MSPQMLRSHQPLGLGFLKVGAGNLEACEGTDFSLWDRSFRTLVSTFCFQYRPQIYWCIYSGLVQSRLGCKRDKLSDVTSS